MGRPTEKKRYQKQQVNAVFFFFFLQFTRDVTMNCEPVENRLKYMTIQIS